MKDESYICPACGAEVLWPAGCIARCGHVPAWTAKFEAERKAKVKKAYGPRTRPPRRRSDTDSPYATVTTLPGHQCPACGGRGWTTNACNSCDLCFGHGRVSQFVYNQVVPPEEDE